MPHQLRFGRAVLGKNSKFNPPVYKIASASLTDDHLLKHIRKTGKPIIASTGMSTYAEIDHAVKVGGIDHVGLGSDFDGIPCAPQGLEDVSKFPNLTRALLEKGYSEQDIQKIYGGNFLRVMRQVEMAAGK